MSTHLFCVSFSVAVFCISSTFAQPDTLWSAIVTGEGNTVLLDATPHSQGGFVGVGYSENDFTSLDFFAARFDESGEVLWTRNYMLTGANEQLDAVVEIDNGNLMLAGFSTGGQTLTLMGISVNGDSLWTRSYAPPGLAKARDLIRLADGNVAVIGYRLGNNENNSDIWLLKCDADGDTLWTRNYGDDQTDIGQRILELDNGDLLLSGVTRQQAATFHWDVWLLRTDAAGNPDGEPQTFGTTDNEVCYGLAVGDNGDWFISGRHETGSSGSEGYLISIPAEGEPTERTYDDGGVIVHLRGVLPRLNGVLCAGWVGNSSFATRPYMALINSQGDMEWIWQFGDAGSNNGFYGIVGLTSGALAYGSAMVGGIQRGLIMRLAPPGGVEGHVTDRVSGEPIPGVRVSAAGQQRYATSNSEGYYSLELGIGTYDLVTWGSCFDSDTLFGIETVEEQIVTADLEVGVPVEVIEQSSVNMLVHNHITSSGTYRFSNSGSGALSFFVETAEINPPGTWLDVTPMMGTVEPGESRVLAVNVTADTTDDGIYDFYGEMYVYTNSCPDTFHIVPVLVTVLDIDNPSPATVREYALHPPYPNPFNAATSIRFDLSQYSEVRLVLFDLTGRKVRTLAEGDFSSGSHVISVSLPDLPSGVYLVRLQAGSKFDVEKIVLLK